MNRRGFLGAMLAAASAPAIVRAESLMKIVVPEKKIITLASLAGDIVGYHFEPGEVGLHDWYADPFGPRHDRTVLPSSFADAFNLQVSRQDSSIHLFMPKESQIVKPKRSFF